MRRVRNQEVIRRLSAKSFQANRTRNIIAAIAIALTAVLFTALFTVGSGLVETMERTSMRQAGGDAHGTMKNITQEEYEILKEHPLIKESGKSVFCAYAIENPEFLKRHVELHYVQPQWYSHWFFEIIDGQAPVGADEILLDETSMRLLGLEPQAGQQVTLDMQIHVTDTERVSRTFTVSGVLKAADSMNVGFAIVSDAYLEKYQEELTGRRVEEGDNVGGINLEILFANSMNLQKKLNQIITDSGFSTDPQSEAFIASNTNWAYMSDGAQSDPMTMLAIAGALALILITGYLIIYNIFQISVLRDIRYYGLLKTIGTTGRQIRRILRRQAFRLCILGTPAGLLLGYFTGKILVPVIARVGQPGEVEVVVHPNPWIFVGAAVFTAFTVLISQWKPARVAARVSPIEAVRYTERQIKRKRAKKSRNGGKIWRMAFSNLGRNRMRTAIVLCSLSLTVVLLNCVYTITQSVDREGFLSKMILCEDILGNAGLWNYDYRPWDEASAAEQGLSETFVQAVQQQESFAEGGRLYGAPYEVTMPVDAWEIPDYITRNEDGVPGSWWNGEFIPYSGYEDGAYQVEYYGIEQFGLSKLDIVEGETDRAAIWEKLQTGEYLLYAAEVDDNRFVIEDQVKHHAGDQVTLTFPGGEEKEYEILSVVKRHQYSMTSRFSGDFTYYVSADEFLSHFSEKYLMSYLLDTKEGQEDAMEAFLEDYTTNTEPSMSYESRKSFEGMFDQMLGMVVIVGTALASVIGFIGLLNFVNTMLTSVVTRQREFAMMEAVGMTGRQLVGMLTIEGLFYALLTLVFALAFGSLISLTLLRGIGAGLWFLRYRFTLLPMAAACPVLLLAGALVPYLIYRLQKPQSLVEQMRE